MRRVTEQQINDLIQNLDFQPLKITVAEQTAGGRGSEAEDVARLVIGWKNNSENFLPEILRQATPKQIEMGVFRLEKMTKGANGKRVGGSERLFPIIIAPFLSERALNRLAEAEISGIDLSGNGVIVVPDKLFVFRTGEKNKFLSSEPIKNVFRGTSSLAARVFFSKPEYENVGEVLEEITRRGGQTTFSTVSKVLKTLEEDLIIEKNLKNSLAGC